MTFAFKCTELRSAVFLSGKIGQKKGKSIANVDFNKEPRNGSIFLVNYFVLFLFPLDI